MSIDDIKRKSSKVPPTTHATTRKSGSKEKTPASQLAKEHIPPSKEPSTTRRSAKISKLYGAIDNKRLEELIQSHKNKALDLTQAKLTCTPQYLMKAILQLPRVILPRSIPFIVTEENRSFLQSEVHTLIASLKETYCNSLREFGPLTREQQKYLPVLKALDELEKGVRQSLHKETTHPLQIASHFSKEIQQFFVKEIYADLLTRQIKIAVDAVEKEKEDEDKYPPAAQKKLLNGLLRQRLESLETSPISPYDLSRTLLQEVGKLRSELDVLKSYVHYEELQANLPDNETLGGICEGTVLNFMRLRLMGAPPESWMMWPSEEARFLQTVHDISVSRLREVQDDELEDRFYTLYDDFLDKKAIFEQTPTGENFDNCTYLHTELFLLATRRLGLYTQQKTLMQQNFKKYHQVRIAIVDDQKKLLDSLEDEIKSYKSKMKEWHIKSYNLDLNVKLLSRYGLHLEELFDEYIGPTDIPGYLTSLKEKAQGSEGHICLGVCTYTIEDEKNTFFEEDPLSLLFYELIHILARGLGLEDRLISYQDKQALMNVANWIREHIPKKDRERLAILFNEKYRETLVKDVIERVLGKNIPGAVFNEMTKKYNNELDAKLKLLQRSPVTKRKSEQDSHAVYIKLSPPYELRDPNRPSFSGFSTNDFNAFLFYISLWMIDQDYTHFKDAIMATPTPELIAKKITHKDKLDKEIAVCHEKAKALQKKAANM